MAQNQNKIRPSLPYEFVRSLKEDDRWERRGLILPEEFDEYHNRDSGRGYVRIVGGRCMGVTVHPGYVGNRMEIGTGWKSFINHYNIQETHTLLLSYQGGNYFEVTVFDEEGERIPYYLTAPCECFNPLRAGGASLQNPMEEYESQTIDEAMEEIGAGIGSSANAEAPTFCGKFSVIVDKVPGCGRSSPIASLVYPVIRQLQPRYYDIATTTRVWRVMLECNDGVAWFSDGWDEFIGGSGLKLWSILDFKVYDGAELYMAVDVVQFGPPTC